MEYRPPTLPLTALNIPDDLHGPAAERWAAAALAKATAWRDAKGNREPILDALEGLALQEGMSELAFWLRHIGCDDSSETPKRVLTLTQLMHVCPRLDWVEWLTLRTNKRSMAVIMRGRVLAENHAMQADKVAAFLAA